MTFINTCADVDDLGGGRFRHTQYVKPVAYDDNGTLRAIASAFTASGIADRPHTVRAARLMTSVADDGMRRIHPTREEDRYVEIGAPYVKVGGVWRKMGFRGGMRTAKRLNWASPQANMSIVHAGHYVKLEIELKRGYVPEDNLVAFPVGLNGLKRSGTNILSDGRAVMSLRAPTMYDAANEMDTRAIDGKFVSLMGQPYYLMMLPDLTGMSRPVIDPTLALQPDADAGQDTYIRSGAPYYDTYNYGVSTELHISRAYFSLLRFDISSIVAGATITSAALELRCTMVFSDNSIIGSAHRALTQWYEGKKNNAAPDAGQDGTTYNLRNANGSVQWGGNTPGGQSGTDFASSASDTETLTTVNTWYSWDILGDVQAWYGGTVNNYGAWIRGDNFNRKILASSDYATASYRPKLIIEYALPGGGNIFQSAILHSSLYGKTLVR